MPGDEAECLNIQANNVSDVTQKIKKRIRERFWYTLNYLSIFAFVLIIYSFALLTDYLLLLLITWLLQDAVKQYSVVALWFDFAQIGLALLTILLAVTHSTLSVIAQLKIELTLSREIKQ
jgi:hypothetical protein